MINWLNDGYDLTVITRSKAAPEGVRSLSAEAPVSKSALVRMAGILPAGLRSLIREPAKKALAFPIMINHLMKIKFGRFDDLLWPVHELTREMQQQLAGIHFDLIITHDCSLLPLAFGLKKPGTRVMLDAREYYPKNYNDQWKWRLQNRPINEYLCRTYLPRCDKIITVSDGLAKEYSREYQVEPEVVMSLPSFHDVSPSETDPRKIRMIYHGWASPSRRTEVMIDLMDHLDERFSLDFMVMLDRSEYAQRFTSMAQGRKTVRLLHPIPMQEIVPFTNSYDIGLFLCPPTNLNLQFALPNKLFEFIQARLAVAIGPGIEMQKIVKKYDCGLISADFTPQSLARELNALTPGKIMYYKRQADQAAKELHEGVNRKRIREIVKDLTGE